MSNIQLDKRDLEKIGTAYTVAMGVELIRQGREKRAGGLINSLQAKGHPPDTVQIHGNHYWRFVNYGVESESIKKPYAPPRIQGLIKWLKRKGIGSSDEKIRGIAYAIATIHARRGMPLRGGRKDRKRMNFLDKAIKHEAKQIDKVVSQVLDDKLELLLRMWKRGGL
jgi:hypothetical protein